MDNIVPFTETDYPNGYSRKDAQEELAKFEGQREKINVQLKHVVMNIKRLRKELDQGGRILESKRVEFKPPLN